MPDLLEEFEAGRVRQGMSVLAVEGDTALFGSVSGVRRHESNEMLLVVLVSPARGGADVAMPCERAVIEMVLGGTSMLMAIGEGSDRIHPRQFLVITLNGDPPSSGRSRKGI